MPQISKPIKPVAQAFMAVLAASLIGATGKVFLASLTAKPAVSMCLFATMQAASCLILTWFAAGRSAKQTKCILKATAQAIGPKWFVVIVIVDIPVGYAQYQALHLAPIGPAIALGTSYPVFLALFEIATTRGLLGGATKRRLFEIVPGGRSFTPKVQASLVLIVVGLVCLGFTEHDDRSHPQALLGLGCALGEALLMAVHQYVTKVLTTKTQNLPTNALIASIVGLFLSPALFILSPPLTEGLQVMAVALFCAPGAVLNWFATAKLRSPVNIGNLMLLQPFLGTLGNLAVHGVFSLTQTLIVVVLVVGIALDLAESNKSASKPTRPREALP